MNFVLARISGQRKNLVKLLSDDKLFEDMTLDNITTVCYDADHNLDEDSWFKIEKFSEQNYFPDFLDHKFDSKEFNSINRGQHDKIKLLLSIQDGNIYFQKTLSSLFLTKRHILTLGDTVKLDRCENLLIVHESPDAVYFKEEDILIFRKLSVISSIFKGIDEIYKEATNEEVDEFLQQDFIELKEDFSSHKVSKPNRKRISPALDTLNKMSNDEKDSIFSYIQEYYSDEKLTFNKDNGKFEISSDVQLKNLIYGIEQRFYTTLFGSEKRLANSIIRL